MKKTIGLYLSCISLTVLVLAFSSCDRESDVGNSSLITGEGIHDEWLQTSGAYDPAYDGDVKHFPTGVRCFDDDILELKENGDYALLQGETKCDPRDSDVIGTGTYTVDGNRMTVSAGEQLLFDGTFTVDATTLTMVEEFTEDGVTYTDTWVFVRR
jgi:hypothetical protein